MYTQIDEVLEAYKKALLNYVSWQKREGIFGASGRDIMGGGTRLWEEVNNKSSHISGMETALGLQEEIIAFEKEAGFSNRQ